MLEQPPTTTRSLDSILRQIKAIIAQSDPERIEKITRLVQGISPAQNARVSIRAGSNDEDERVTITFFVTETAKNPSMNSLEVLFHELLSKASTDSLKRIGQVLDDLSTYQATAYEWKAWPAEYNALSKSFSSYFFIYKKQYETERS
jgi:hypothetical protein